MARVKSFTFQRESIMTDLVKLKLYMDYIRTQIYSEGESTMHSELTETMVEQYVDPLNLASDAEILDVGCGPGYFLDLMQQRGYKNLTGVTVSSDDIDTCRGKGHQIIESDINFLPNRDESVDFIFLRHALEHSIFPYIALLEYNRILKQRAKIYIEVPAPACDRPHEYNKNHYSIMEFKMLHALLLRSGFEIDLAQEVKKTITSSDTGKQYLEVYYVVVATKKCPIDIK